MPETFNFRYLNDVAAEPEDRTVVTDFGGYRQVSSAGLNPVVEKFKIQCVFIAGEATEAARLRAFINLHRTITPFLWVAPGGVAATKWQFERYPSFTVKSVGSSEYEWRWSISLRKSFNP
jgi:phage-related protein